MASTASNHISCGYNDHYHLYMTITQNKRDASTNKSNVTVKMYAQSDSTTYKYEGDSTIKLTVDGTQRVSKTISVSFANKATVQLASWTGDISHGADGSKKLSCSGSFTASSNWLSGGSISCSIQLESIPRATKPTLSASSVELGKAVTINIAPAVSSWTHNIYYRIGTGSWTRFATGVTANYSWTVPLTIANSFPSATSGTITIGLNTYNGSTQIGSTQTIALKITVPSTVKPSVSALAAAETVSGMSTYGYVQGKSKLKLTATVSSSYSSTIKSYKYEIGSQSYTGTENTYTMGEVVKDSGTVTVKVTVTDSRGRTGTKSITITVLAYSIPQVTAFTCVRCGDSSGAVNTNGGYLKVTMKFAVSSLNSKNAKSYKLEYALSGSTTWTSLTSGNVYSYDGSYISTSAILNTSNSYQIRLTVADSFTSTVFVRDISTATRLLSYIIKKTALAVGKVAELTETFDIGLVTKFRKKVTCDTDVDINGILAAYNNINAYKDIGVSGNMWFNQTYGCFFVTLDDGTQLEAINLFDGTNLSIGWGHFSQKKGNLCLGGLDVVHRVSATASPVEYRPYYRKGDSIDVRIGTAGFVTTSTKDYMFIIPLGKPVIGNPSVSVSSINGLIIRQNNTYVNDSSAWTTPSKYSAWIRDNNTISVTASFGGATSGATNNSPVGIDASIRVTFS